MSTSADNSRKTARGRPFPKGVSGNRGGRPKKTVTWREAEDALREAIPRLMLMDKKDLKLLLEANPTGAEMLAAKYIHEHPIATVDRMLGKTVTPLSGVDGKPLIPDAPAALVPALDMSKWTERQVDNYIAATAQAHGASVSAAAPAPAPEPAPEVAAAPPAVDA
jgi:hypothetical protein